MATLVSPGVSVTVVDESIGSASAQGTVPLVVLATAENKSNPDGSGIAPGTLQENAEKLYLMSSQREILQTFGDPIFYSIGGIQLHGDPTNEYGLLAAHSYLGLANRAYVIRADIDLAELQPSVEEPTSAKPVGTVWFDTDDTLYGINKYTSGSFSSVTIAGTIEGDPTGAIDAELEDFLNSLDVGDVVVAFLENASISPVVLNDGTVLYATDPLVESIEYFVKITDSNSPSDDFRLLHETAGYNVGPVWPTGANEGDWWVKTSPGSSAGVEGVDYVVRIRNSAGSYVQLEMPMFVDNDDATADEQATAYYNDNPDNGDFYARADRFESRFEIYIWNSSSSAWEEFTAYIPSDDEPRDGPSDGTLWYNPLTGVDGDGLSSVDILYNSTGTGVNTWENVALPGYNYDPASVLDGSEARPTEPMLFLLSSDPVSVFSTTVQDNDYWVDTDDLDGYPFIYRRSGGDWTLLDNSDQTTPNGVLFRDARADPNQSNTELDYDAPLPGAYPEGMTLWNTRYSTRNVKEWDADHTVDTGTNTVEGRWVSVSGVKDDGSLLSGDDARKSVVVQALAKVIVSSEVLRSDAIYYNIITCPGYTELIDELISLNIDRRETGFVVGDSPFTLTDSGTDLQEWCSNANNASGNGEDGLVSADPNLGVYYPSGLGTNVDGAEVVVPASHMIMRVLGYNDQVSYPWFAPAGLQRGRVSNASAVGYVSEEGEFTPVTLNQGQRDILYTNNVNPIAFIPNQGIVAYGQKTRSPVASAVDRINVARLVEYLRLQADLIAQPFLFEPNDTLTRGNVTDAFNRFLSELITLRGLFDYLVVCDESNNTPERIDRNELWIDIAIQPIRAIEFIYIPIRIKSTGADL